MTLDRIPAPGRRLRLGVAALGVAASVLAAAASPHRLMLDETDRGAFRAWFTYLADTQFEQRSPDVVDCAALIRHAYREALRPHTTAWFQSARLPRLVSLPDVRQSPPMRDGALLLFRVASTPERFAEFADAETIVTLNSRRVGRDVRAAEPGDLLYFRHDDAESPSHLMLFVGESRFDRERRDWLVYHTGPDQGTLGEVRKVALADLERHPSPRWRPVSANAEFIGVFRLNILDREH